MFQKFLGRNNNANENNMKINSVTGPDKFWIFSESSVKINRIVRMFLSQNGC